MTRKNSLFLFLIINCLFAADIALRKTWLSGILVNYFERESFSFSLISYFNHYGIDFYRRSLIGNLFQVLHIDISISSILIFKWILINTLLFILLKIFSHFKTRFWVVLLFVIAPFTFQQIIYFGLTTTDLLTLVFVSLSYYLLSINKYIYLIPFISALAILNHTVYIFAFLPALLLLLYIKNDLKLFITFTLISFVFIFLIQAYGDFDVNNLIYLEQNIKENHFKLAHQWEYPILAFSSFYDNISITLSSLVEMRNENPLGFYLIPLGIIYGGLYIWNSMNIRQLFGSKGFWEKLIFIASFSGIALFFIGIDTPRWIGLILFNTTLVYLTLGGKLQIRNPIIWLTFFLGAMGTSSTFPFINKALKILF